MPPSFIVSKEEAESALCAVCYETFNTEDDERKPARFECGHIAHMECISGRCKYFCGEGEEQ
ncbi:hypothetical protein LAU_0310 [Lausannevirus]|uniref:Zinc finger RING-type eukaryotic domain-containing protein n=1 Tax=Lausannevirus TaxID=999883 RepID=F2WLN8_9VIRU|nr:hypothetical protein LAU_0310 [Lausannevirus]AEA07161.1 hypothetical protein LAU_0310 [Lausannevirus]